MNKSRKVITGLIILAAIGALFFCGIHIFLIQDEYAKGQKAYEEIEEYVDIPEEPDAKTEEDETDVIDFSRLQGLYPDIVGWIQISDLNISYPILQGMDNSFYLNHLPDGETGKCGSIFLDYHNTSDFSDKNSIVYGHNMKDGTMFAALKRYQELSGDTYFYVYTPDVTLRYQVIAAYHGTTANMSYMYYFSEENDVLEFLAFMEEISEIKTGAAYSAEDRFITLSTCNNRSSMGRFIIHGKLVSIREPTPIRMSLLMHRNNKKVESQGS